MYRQRVLYVDTCSRPPSLQRAATRIDGHALGLFVGLLGLLALAGMLYLSQACKAAELRYALRDSEQAASQLEERVGALRCQIALGESITSLESRARRLGLVDAPAGEPQLVCYVPVQPAPQEPVEPAQAASPRPTPSWAQWLFSRLQPGQ